MWPILTHLVIHIFFCWAEEGKRYGPVFEEQPTDTIYPEESQEGKVSMNCRARANPPPEYRWRLNNWDINLGDDHYTMVGGNLVIKNPDKSRDQGKYTCIVSNIYGKIMSLEATLSFGYLDTFPVEERYQVRVKEGIGAVLICDPPPHYPDDLSYRWLLNEFPVFIAMDKRRFVSQTNGNLYIAKVEQSDRGNYSCFVTSPSITKSVFSKFIPLVPQSDTSTKRYPADISVGFKDTYALKDQNVTLECFALGNPVPVIRWRKVDEPMPATAEVSMSGAVLKIFNIQPEDEGTYECEAENIKGKDNHQARVYVQAQPEWVEHINDTERDIGSDLHWPCIAKGKPVPTIRWLKNGTSYGKGELKIWGLTLKDAGMYQCIAENHYGIIQANAELKVIALAPTFELNPMRKKALAAKGGRAIIECKPKAAPKPKFSWSKGTELLTNNSRILIWEDGSLEIINITKLDEGSYTCFAENDRGKANSTATLSVTAATKITLAPSNADVTVGENATMQCHASHDPSLDLTFIWSLNGFAIEFDKEDGHYERNTRIEGGSELIIKNTQLKHAGRYMCTAQTIVDNSSASADLVVRGPPGPPGGVRTEEVRDTSLKLLWSSGTDNHQPISKYTIQYKNSLSEDWKDAKTEIPTIEGNMESAKVIDLLPWMDYEFRVIATNTLGMGEPSLPSPQIRTDGSVPIVAPSDVGGGGGSNRELTVTWVPLSQEYNYGDGFGYIVAFKSFNDREWRKVIVQDIQSGRYVHKDDTITPATQFQVKVKAFNSKGEGPYSSTANIYSADDVPTDAPSGVSVSLLSASEVSVTWHPVYVQSVEGYQVLYWRIQDNKAAAHRVQVKASEYTVRLEGLLPDTAYNLEVSAFNSAGYGPPSDTHRFTTRKAPPSQVPTITSVVRSGSHYIISWGHVSSLSNESPVTGYKVLYRPDGQIEGKLYSTGNHYVQVPAPKDGEYIVEVRASSEGGDGAVAFIKLSSNATGMFPSILGVLLPVLSLLMYMEF
ncbi:contactin-1 [Spea bombifrons]|uniref:contactin-1 n=1 Tax=Spea bombifrons TaxID=233779 RepID=UPI00234B2693|nr:contactin-1 [Spea bombifrons]XP_053319069.1 contactin-1 [Spea bombifrons]